MALNFAGIFLFVGYLIFAAAREAGVDNERERVLLREQLNDDARRQEYTDQLARRREAARPRAQNLSEAIRMANSPAALVREAISLRARFGPRPRGADDESESESDGR